MALLALVVARDCRVAAIDLQQTKVSVSNQVLALPPTEIAVLYLMVVRDKKGCLS
jgi:hypothetical protein